MSKNFHELIYHNKIVVIQLFSASHMHQHARKKEYTSIF